MNDRHPTTPLTLHRLGFDRITSGLYSHWTAGLSVVRYGEGRDRYWTLRDDREPGGVTLMDGPTRSSVLDHLAKRLDWLDQRERA